MTYFLCTFFFVFLTFQGVTAAFPFADLQYRGFTHTKVKRVPFQHPVHISGTCSSKAFVKINPASLLPAASLGFSHIVVHPKSEMAHVRGLAASTPDLVIQGMTIGEQLHVAAKNLDRVLETLEADAKDVMTMHVYTVGLDPGNDLGIIKDLGDRYGRPVLTLLGISGFAQPDIKVAIETTVSLSSKFLNWLNEQDCEGNRLKEEDAAETE